MQEQAGTDHQYRVHLRRLREAYPGLTIETIDTDRGQFNDILVINGELIFRFPRSRSAAESLRQELAILRAIRGHVSLPVPDPMYIHDDPDSGQPRFVGYRMIPGEPLRPQALRGMDTSSQDSLANRLATFLRQLHSISPETLPVDLAVGEDAAYWHDLYADIQEHLFAFMRPDARKSIVRSFERYLSNAHHFTFQPRLRHGDFGPSNIMFDPLQPKITGVIDFGSARLGDPAQDIGGMLASYGEAFVERMAAGYPDIVTMLDRAAFYVGTYALQQALHARQVGDQTLFDDGLADYV